MTKPKLDRLCVVTATLDLSRAKECVNSWASTAEFDFTGVLVWSGTALPLPKSSLHHAMAPEVDHKDDKGNIILVRPEILGVVPAFALGVQYALAHTPAEIIACFHDDLLIEGRGWDVQVLTAFDQRPQMGLAGFCGGTGLGAADIYQTPYSPHQLAREGVVSNMRDAEAHGARVGRDTRVAVLDGFSQIGRRAYWEGNRLEPGVNLFQRMADWGVVHHFYDGMLGAFAARLGWEVWMLPVPCWHKGGQTAVGDSRYSEWAKTIVPGGDQDFWEMAHDIGYREFKDVLPIRV